MMSCDWMIIRRNLVKCCWISDSIAAVSSFAAWIIISFKSLLHLSVISFALSRRAMYAAVCSFRFGMVRAKLNLTERGRASSSSIRR